MKIRSRDNIYNFYPKLKRPTVLSFGMCLYIFCLTILPIRMLQFVTGIALANSSVEIEQEYPQDDLADPNESIEQLKDQLFRTEITPLKNEKDQKSRDELRQLIQRIRSVEFIYQEPAPEELIVVKEKLAAEPNEASFKPEVSGEESQNKQTEPEAPYEPITDQTLQMLESAIQQPEKLDNPFKVGEILFISGKLQQAALLYQEALKRTNPDDTTLAEEKAWILFQAGNCLRNSSMPMAAKMYGQLITEYPDSPWTELAKAQSNVITWFEQDEPYKLIAEYQTKTEQDVTLDKIDNTANE